MLQALGKNRVASFKHPEGYAPARFVGMVREWGGKASVYASERHFESSEIRAKARTWL